MADGNYERANPEAICGCYNCQRIFSFKEIEDFNPARIVMQVEPLRKLFEARQRLMDLLSKLDGNDKLDELLHDIANNPESQKSLKDQTAGAAPASA